MTRPPFSLRNTLWPSISALLLGTTPLCAQETNAPVASPAPSQPTFGLDRLSLLQPEVMGYPLWQYLASLIWIVLAFVVAGLVDYVVTHFLRRLAARTKTEWDDKLIATLHAPVKITVILVMLNAGIHVFAWPPWGEKILSGLFVFAVAGTVVFLALRLVDLLLQITAAKFLGADAQLASLMLPVLGKSLKVFVVIIGVLTISQFMGLPIASLIAGLGVGGIAVALAAQSTLANIFGSITILADRPFRVGDRIQLEGFDGMVETIGLRSTRVRTLEGYLVTIPNKTVADTAISNITLRPTIREKITFNLTYDTSGERMQEAVNILREVFQQHPLTHDAIVNWKSYGAHSLDVFIIYWCKSTDYREFLGALHEINIEIKRRFDAAQLEFAFPTQTIHLQQPDTTESTRAGGHPVP